MGFFKKIFNGPANQESKADSQKVSSPQQINDAFSNFSDGEFRVIDIYNITGIGVIPVGEVVSGKLANGMKSILNGKVVEIKTMEANHKKLSVANVGDKIGLSLKNASKDDLQKGQIIKFISAQKFNAGQGLSAAFG